MAYNGFSSGKLNVKKFSFFNFKFQEKPFRTNGGTTALYFVYGLFMHKQHLLRTQHQHQQQLLTGNDTKATTARCRLSQLTK